MKKLLSFICCLCLAISVNASAAANTQFEFADKGVTIVFDEDTNLSPDEQQYVAERLVYGQSDDSISTYAWCWLTGHDLVSEGVIEIKHKVSADAPRCLKTTYEVITCTKCDHMETNVLSSVYIDCCPED